MMDNGNIWAAGWGEAPGDPVFTDEVTKVKWDFNYGLRIKTPPYGGPYKLHVETATCDTLCDTVLPEDSTWCMPFKYYIDYKFSISSKDGSLYHTLCLKDKLVLIIANVRTLGDSIAWLSYVQAFQDKHRCRCVTLVNKAIYDLFKDSSGLTLDVIENKNKYTPYATYYLGLFFDESYSKFWQPEDFRLHGLHEQARNILGLPADTQPTPPNVAFTGAVPECLEGKKYVCISYSASKANKLWHHPNGWRNVINHLKYLGYEVVCIDKDSVIGVPPHYHHMPNDVIDLTGAFPLQQRVDVLKGASMFIGLGSGLAWLAWCCRIPVILISGFSLPYAEFYTKYRVINYLCNCTGCWNDTRIVFNKHEYMWCPRIDDKIEAINKQIANATDAKEIETLKDERRKLEESRFLCSQTISPNMVIGKINEVIEDNEKC